MKLVYFFLVCITEGIIPLKGQLHLDSAEGILLRFVYSPYYNGYQKSCCKFISNNCMVFVTSTGYVHQAYKERIGTYEHSGMFDVQMWNLHASDVGIYRCEIVGTQIYQFFQFDIADSKTELKPTPAFPEPTRIIPVNQSVNVNHNLFEKHKEIPSLKFTLGIIFGGLVIILIISLAVVLYKRNISDKSDRRLSSAQDPTQQLPQELIYTTVDFTSHQKTPNMFNNPDIHCLRPDKEAQEHVEYATVAGVV